MSLLKKSYNEMCHIIKNKDMFHHKQVENARKVKLQLQKRLTDEQPNNSLRKQTKSGDRS